MSDCTFYIAFSVKNDESNWIWPTSGTLFIQYTLITNMQGVQPKLNINVIKVK